MGKIEYCLAEAKRGTGTGVCDKPLDERGNCTNPTNHIGR